MEEINKYSQACENGALAHIEEHEGGLTTIRCHHLGKEGICTHVRDTVKGLKVTHNPKCSMPEQLKRQRRAIEETEVAIRDSMEPGDITEE